MDMIFVGNATVVGSIVDNYHQIHLCLMFTIYQERMRQRTFLCDYIKNVYFMIRIIFRVPKKVGGDKIRSYASVTYPFVIREESIFGKYICMFELQCIELTDFIITDFQGNLKQINQNQNKKFNNRFKEENLSSSIIMF